jgi:WD40-like Beta Propeller Repeat
MLKIRILERALLFALCSAAVYLVACRDSVAPHTPGIRIVSGAGASDTIGALLRDPLVVEVRTSDGRFATGVEIEFVSRSVGAPAAYWPLYISKTDNSGFSPTLRDTTDNAGRATVYLALGVPVGPAQVVVTVPSLNMEATAAYTVRVGAPASIVVAPRDTPVFVGGSYVLRAKSVDRLGDSISSNASFSTTSSVLQVAANGVVRASDVGRARVTIAMGSLIDSALVSAIPRASMAVRDYGTFVGDTVGVAQVDLDGGNKRWIAKFDVVITSYSPSNQLSPKWVPGTGQVVYPEVVNGSTRLFVGDSTGAARRLVDPGFGLTNESDLDVSHDGAWVYFVGFEANGMQAIWRVPVSGGTPERITPDDFEYRCPSLSPDLTRMAYVSGERLYVRDLASGVSTMLSTNQAAVPVWSPTGDWIMYGQGLSEAGFPAPLRLIRPDGSGDHLLIDGSYHPGGTWSPDGRYVVVERADYNLYRMEMIDVGLGTRLPLIYSQAWYAPAWRH